MYVKEFKNGNINIRLSNYEIQSILEERFQMEYRCFCRIMENLFLYDYYSDFEEQSAGNTDVLCEIKNVATGKTYIYILGMDSKTVLSGCTLKLYPIDK